MARKKVSKQTKAETTPQDEELTKLIDWVNESDDETIETRDLAEKARRYYDSEQWTDEEVAKLKAQKQAATVINRIKPKMDGLMGMERVNKTTAKAFPRTPKHTAAAQAVTEAVRYVLQNNDYAGVRSSSWDNICVEGTSGVEVCVKKNGDDFRITIKHIMWDRLIWDVHSRRKDFSDANYLGQVVWMDYDEALDMYPESADILNSLIEGSQTYDDKPRWLNGARERVKIVELYYRKSGNVYYACFTRGGFLKKPQLSPYVNEEKETEWPYEFASAFVTREGTRYGAVRQLTDIQDEINKRRSKALHLMSVRQVRWERGAVEDINKARQELAKPDGVIETTPGMEFEILKTGDMAAAQFNLLTEAKQEIDAVSFSAAAAGKEARNMSGVALRSREMASQTELAPMFDVLKGLDIRVYRKVWNCIRKYWGAEKWIRVTDDENNLKFVGLNAPTTKGDQVMKQAQEKGLPPEQLQVLQQQIAANPEMQEQVIENNVAELDVDIVMDDAPDAVTTQAEDFAVLGEMVKSGFQMPPEAVIEASPLSNKDKILKMMRESKQNAVPPQVQAQMQKMDEELQKLGQENQALKQDQQAKMVEMQFEEKRAMAELQMKARIEAEQLRMKEEAAMRELALKEMIAQREAEIRATESAREHQLNLSEQQFDQLIQRAELALKARAQAAQEESKEKESSESTVS